MNQLFGLQHRGDRYFGHSSRHTQVPVPVTISLDVTKEPSPCYYTDGKESRRH